MAICLCIFIVFLFKLYFNSPLLSNSLYLDLDLSPQKIFQLSSVSLKSPRLISGIYLRIKSFERKWFSFQKCVAKLQIDASKEWQESWHNAQITKTLSSHYWYFLLRYRKFFWKRCFHNLYINLSFIDYLRISYAC